MNNPYYLTDEQANILKDTINTISTPTEKIVAKRHNITVATLREKLDEIFIALGNGRITVINDAADDNYDLEMETKLAERDMETGSD